MVIRKTRLQWRNVTHTDPLGQNQFITTAHFVHYKGSCTIIVQLNCTPFWSLHNSYTSINLRAMQVCYMYFHHWKICTNCTLPISLVVFCWWRQNLDHDVLIGHSILNLPKLHIQVCTTSILPKLQTLPWTLCNYRIYHVLLHHIELCTRLFLAQLTLHPNSLHNALYTTSSCAKFTKSCVLNKFCKSNLQANWS